MPSPFGTAPDGSPVARVTLARAGTTVRIMTWGASLQDFRLDGLDHPLVLGSPRFTDYVPELRNFGAIVGRVANRIAKGRTTLDGREIVLARNEGGRTSIHGGPNGSAVRNWTLEAATEHACTLSLVMPDGDGGFPGTLTARAAYSLDETGALCLTMTATTDAPTFCNLAHHAFWSLTGGGLDGHEMRIEADHYLPVDAHKIPQGAPQDVAGSGFDFRALRPVVIPGAPEIDHNFCLRDGAGRVRHICLLQTDRLALEIASDAPGLQVYDASRMDTTPACGFDGKPYGPHSGVALEPQFWPDAPNHPDYPPIDLAPGDTFRQHCRFHIYRR